MKKTKVINLIAPPGSGKSTLAMELTAHFKWHSVAAEYVSEFAKDLVWDQCNKLFENQLLIFANQHHRQFRLLGQVDFIVTDSPLILSTIYNENHLYLNQTILEAFNTFDNINFFLHRTKPYVKLGRYQEEHEANELGTRITKFLSDYKIFYYPITAQENASKDMIEIIKQHLNLPNLKGL